MIDVLTHSPTAVLCAPRAVSVVSYVRKRPGVDHFLRYCAEKFEVVVFTASLAKYADPLLDILDRDHTVRVRLFREACVQHYGNYVKVASIRHTYITATGDGASHQLDRSSR